MPKEELQGSLEEQLATIYDLVQERMAAGKYGGAIHYAKEIIKYDSNYRDIQAILAEAKRAKREQNFLLAVSLIGAVMAVAVTRRLGWTSDWQSLLAAGFGAVVFFFLTNIILLLRK
ncbi:MAG: hypothetical protein GXP42_16495 [Chloroflexi bacterium]|nr:hypothetical protein [Chloroflexota bacterium]